MGHDEIALTVRNYLAEDLGADPNLPVDQPLFSAGIIDSFDLVSILSFVREKFGVEISPLEINMENFDSVSGIAKLIESLRADT